MASKYLAENVGFYRNIDEKTPHIRIITISLLGARCITNNGGPTCKYYTGY
jgi:hypothetical protein